MTARSISQYVILPIGSRKSPPQAGKASIAPRSLPRDGEPLRWDPKDNDNDDGGGDDSNHNDQDDGSVDKYNKRNKTNKKEINKTINK